MAAPVHATNVIPINRGSRRLAARQHKRIVVAAGSRKIIPLRRLKQARRVRRMEAGSAALLVAASITAALAIARFYLAKSAPLTPVSGMPTNW